MKKGTRTNILATALACVCVGLAIPSYYFLNPQAVNFRAIGKWMKAVESQRLAYESNEKINMHVRCYTGGDGVIRVQLFDPADDAQTTRTMKFIESLRPPRPVWWDVYRKDGTEYHFVQELPYLNARKPKEGAHQFSESPQ